MLKNSAGWAVSNTLAAQPPSGGADTVNVQMVACQACEACAYFSCRMPVRALECEASPVFLSFVRLYSSAYWNIIYQYPLEYV